MRRATHVRRDAFETRLIDVRDTRETRHARLIDVRDTRETRHARLIDVRDTRETRITLSETRNEPLTHERDT